MGDFIGRKQELEQLESMFEDNKFRACAIIGRRRIGKTSLIKKFIEGKKSIYIQFIRASMENNLTNFAVTMSDYFGKDMYYNNIFEFFRDLSSLAMKDRYVFVLDEYPFLCDKDGTFSSIVQSFIDNGIRDSFLIISGSSVAMLDSEISSYDRPLYGRVRKLYLDMMPFDESRLFHPKMDDRDSLRLYLTVGGVPFYHSGIDVKTYEEFMDGYVLPENSVFHYEGENIFNREFSNPEDLISVMGALGAGKNDIKSISDHTGINRVTCSKLVDTLVGMRFVSSVEPMLGAPTKPVLYRISDPLLSFHYGVIKRKSFLPDASFRCLSEDISTHLGRAFEDFCADHLKKNYPVVKIGKWWGDEREYDDYGNLVKDKNGKPVKRTVEVDIVAEARFDRNKTMIFAECKFRNQKVDTRAVKEFEDRIEKISKDCNPRLVMFSVSGFTEGAVDHSNGADIDLIGPEQLFGSL